MIILAGMVALTLAMAAYAATSEPAGDATVTAYVSQLAQKLGLTPEQQAKIQKILEDGKAAIAADPSNQNVLVQGMWARIAEALTPAQQEKLRQMQPGAGGGEKPANPPTNAPGDGTRTATSASAPAGPSYLGVPTASKMTPIKVFNDANEPSWFAYVRRPDAAFKYDVQSAAVEGGTHFRVEMTSQVWQGLKWTSPMSGFIPTKSIAPDTALLFIGAMMQDQTMREDANALGLAFASVGGYPNPGFGLQPDQAMLYGVQQCLQTGDPNWSPLASFVKAAVRAMDVIEAVSAKQGTPIKKFILAGHSKCGYTSWWTAIFDPRVIGIAPIGAHVLNFAQQIEVGASYTRALLQPGQDATEIGKQFLTMTDPYVLRAKLTMPKLNICGTNDEIFPPKTLGCFWEGLPGPKYLLNVDNAMHGTTPHGEMNDPKAAATLYAFARAVATGKALPTIEAKFSEVDGAIRLVLTTSVAAKAAKLWTTSSSNEINYAKWASQPMEAQEGGKSFAASAPKVTVPVQAVYGEVEFEQDGRTCWLTTEYKIVKR